VLGKSGPAWALPPAPPDRWGIRLGLVLVPVVLVAAAALVRLQRDAGDVGAAVALAVAGVAGLVAAVALHVLQSVRLDERLALAGLGFALLPAVTSLRALAAEPGSGADAALAVLQWLAVPVLVLCAAAGAGRRLGALAAAVVAVAAAAPALAPVRFAGLVDDGGRAPSLAALELAVALLGTVAVLLWLRRSPEQDAGPHGWVAAALVVGVLAAAARAVLPDRTGADWQLLEQLSTLAVVVPALGLVLSSCRPYRRQSRRWRQLEAQVRSLRAASPLLPGPSITPEDEDGLPSESEVRALLDIGRVGIALQPVVGLADGVVVGHEALARFGGRVPTDRWFRGAGLHGLSEELELLTLRAALRTLPGLPEDVSLAVNLSPVALAGAEILVELRRADLRRVVVEITEHEAVRDYAAARRHLDQLRAEGARIAVDDVGAGFASLRHLLLLRPDIIKLDQSLTRGIDRDPRQRGVVVALTRFAAEVGIEVVAEGVETAEQAVALQSIGLVVGQGWGLGVPVLQREEPAP